MERQFPYLCCAKIPAKFTLALFEANNLNYPGMRHGCSVWLSGEWRGHLDQTKVCCIGGSRTVIFSFFDLAGIFRLVETPVITKVDWDLGSMFFFLSNAMHNLVTSYMQIKEKENHENMGTKMMCRSHTVPQNTEIFMWTPARCSWLRHMVLMVPGLCVGNNTANSGAGWVAAWEGIYRLWLQNLRQCIRSGKVSGIGLFYAASELHHVPSL